MKKLTKETIELYLDNEGSNCPICNADLNEEGSYSSLDVEGSVALQEITCNRCDSVWTDIFKRVDIYLTRLKGKSVKH